MYASNPSSLISVMDYSSLHIGNTRSVDDCLSPRSCYASSFFILAEHPSVAGSNPAVPTISNSNNFRTAKSQIQAILY
jgi:hypothetical protein